MDLQHEETYDSSFWEAAIFCGRSKHPAKFSTDLQHREPCNIFLGTGELEVRVHDPGLPAMGTIRLWCEVERDITLDMLQTAKPSKALQQTGHWSCWRIEAASC